MTAAKIPEAACSWICMMKNVIAVIVTYNRLNLLKRCISGVMAQTFPPSEIIVVDNASDDGTREWLDEFVAEPNNVAVSVHHLPENTGGAGGFETGMGLAVEHGAEAVWVMDDDTLPTPTALDVLVKTVGQFPDVGFAASRAEWTDGSLNAMNLPMFRRDKRLAKMIETLREPAPCEGATFVSMLVPAEVIRKVGLPIGEFFIWHDDIEYTLRIIEAGYRGLYVPGSVVVHATATNTGPSIITAPLSSKHRFYYQIRNQIFTKRLHSGHIRSMLSNWVRLYRFKREIGRRADHRDEFLEEVINGYRDSKKFNPMIKFPTPHDENS